MNPKENENLWNAACSGDHRLIIKILNVGADVNYVGAPGTTSLFEACERGHADAVRILLANGANVEIRDQKGWLPLHAASFAGRLECVEYVVNHNRANIYKLTDDGSSSLHLAIEQSQIEVVRFLTQNGARCSLKDGKGRTPLELATNPTIKEIIEKQLNLAKKSAPKKSHPQICQICNNGKVAARIEKGKVVTWACKACALKQTQEVNAKEIPKSPPTSPNTRKRVVSPRGPQPIPPRRPAARGPPPAKPQAPQRRHPPPTRAAPGAQAGGTVAANVLGSSTPPARPLSPPPPPRRNVVAARDDVAPPVARRVQQRPTRSTAYRPMPANLTRKAATVREGKTQLYDDEVTPAHNTLKSPRGNNALSTSTSNYGALPRKSEATRSLAASMPSSSNANPSSSNTNPLSSNTNPLSSNPQRSKSPPPRPAIRSKSPPRALSPATRRKVRFVEKSAVDNDVSLAAEAESQPPLPTPPSTSSSSSSNETNEKISKLENEIQSLKENLAKKTRSVVSLHTDNQRLKSEIQSLKDSNELLELATISKPLNSSSSSISNDKLTTSEECTLSYLDSLCRLPNNVKQSLLADESNISTFINRLLEQPHRSVLCTRAIAVASSIVASLNSTQINANSLVMSGLSSIIPPLARLAANKANINNDIYLAARAVFADMLACGLMLRAEGGGVKPAAKLKESGHNPRLQKTLSKILTTEEVPPPASQQKPPVKPRTPASQSNTSTQRPQPSMRGGVPLPVHRPTSPPSRALSPGTLQRQRTKTSDFDDVPEPPAPAKKPPQRRDASKNITNTTNEERRGRSSTRGSSSRRATSLSPVHHMDITSVPARARSPGRNVGSRKRFARTSRAMRTQETSPNESVLLAQRLREQLPGMKTLNVGASVKDPSNPLGLVVLEGLLLSRPASDAALAFRLSCLPASERAKAKNKSLDFVPTNAVLLSNGHFEYRHVENNAAKDQSMASVGARLLKECVSLGTALGRGNDSDAKDCAKRLIYKVREMRRVVTAVAPRGAEFNEPNSKLTTQAELGMAALTTAVANLVKLAKQSCNNDSAALLERQKLAKTANGGIAKEMRSLLALFPANMRRALAPVDDADSSPVSTAAAHVLQLGPEWRVLLEDTDACIFRLEHVKNNKHGVQFRVKNTEEMMNWINRFEDMGLVCDY